MIKMILLIFLCFISSVLFAKENGRYSAYDQILGSKVTLFKHFQQKISKNSGLLKLSNALYYNCPYLPLDHRCEKIDPDERSSYKMIPLSLKRFSDFLADQLLADYLFDSNLTANEAINYDSYFPGLLRINDKDMNNWSVDLYVKKGGFTYKEFYTSDSIIALHELKHLERTSYGQRRLEKLDRLTSVKNELIPSMHSLLISSYILDKVGAMDSLRNLVVPTEKGQLDLFQLTNFMNQLLENYGEYEDAFLSQEMNKFLTKYYYKAKEEIL